MTITQSNHVGTLTLFRIGLGPSSSHTVGPMRAAKSFVQELVDSGLLGRTTRLTMTLYGSLGATGAGHGTPGALLAGLEGYDPETCAPEVVIHSYDTALTAGKVTIEGHDVPFSADDMVSAPLTRLPLHSNGIRFVAHDGDEKLLESVYYSVGGGFIEKDGDSSEPSSFDTVAPYPFDSGVELIQLTHDHGLSIAEISLLNDVATHGEQETRERISAVWATMKACIEAGLDAEGMLPGTLNVKRRAKAMATKLRDASGGRDHESDWLQTFAIAVNEENAAGNRVVTAPTNGAAGIIPAVGYWAQRFGGKTDEEIESIYLPTASAIGSLYKKNASISGAEAGCQGEVGSACSMAAAGVTALMGGTAEQIENAAEIAMEHNLGLTCDPVGGYVQLPCIERNAIAAGTAVAAMRLALLGDGSHKISLDNVIETMRQTGLDMSTKYKETSTGGLAVNVIEC
ncbi:MAG: L-serine ammonia-lyase [Pontimonas sp.]